MLKKDYNSPFKFCDLEKRYSSWSKSKVVVLPVPYDLTTSYKPGTSLGPRAIIDASRFLETYDEEKDKEIYKIGIFTASEVKSKPARPEDIIEKVEGDVISIIKAGKMPVVIGGEHSISLGPIKAFKKEQANFSVLQLDAHRDLRSTYQGSQHSHACIAKRIIEFTDLTQVGIRSLSKGESKREYKNLRTFFMKDMIKDKYWMDEALDSLKNDKVYVTIDVDVFDPSIMPACGTPEPGGIDWYSTLELLRKVSEEREVIGFDVVELAPIRANIAPDFLAAKLIYKFLGYLF